MANNNTEKIMIGAGAAALAAGIYFFQTKQGKRNAKKLKGWMVRMKGEVLEKLEEAEEVTEPVYRGIVDTVANAEIVASKIPRSEILALATDLKRQWNMIRRMSGGKKTTRRSASRNSTKSSKAKASKTAKKSSK
jgi:hypothetical protein